MREIEFRAWDKFKKVFIPNDVWAVVQTDFKAFGIMLKDWENYKEGEYFYENSQELTEYTGLKDKNGTKIFEGDIVKWGHVAGGLENPIRIARVNLFPSLQFEIIKNREQFFKRTFEYGSFMYQNTEKYLEVIGNIHDNPELLK